MDVLLGKFWENNEWLSSSFASRRNGCLQKVAVVLAVGASVHVGVSLLKKFLKHRRQRSYRRNTVILHTFPRSKTVPSMCSYDVKLETFLRLSKISFELDTVDSFGPYQKSPWISYNDDIVPDSTLCIEYLNKKFNVNLNSKLNVTQLAISRALQIMTEEHLVWCFVMQRYVYDKNASYVKLISWYKFMPKKLLTFLVKRLIIKRALHQGIAFHTQDAVLNFAKKDFKALSDILGDKPFFFGWEISEVDCAMFGFLAMIVWTNPGSPFEEWFDAEFKNLKVYCQRVKQLVWPDWDDLYKTKS